MGTFLMVVALPKRLHRLFEGFVITQNVLFNY